MAEHGDVWRSPCGAIELRCGDWQTALADVERVDAVITDPPYGKRVHAGHDHAVRDTRAKGNEGRRALSYGHWAADDVTDFVAWWSARCGWMVALTSHDLFPSWQREFTGNGRCDFHPLPALIPGMTVRLAGDGPSSWCIWIAASRPRTMAFAKWGTLPGGYTGRPESGHIGGKPLWLMRAIVRDYSRPGDIVCDPCAGGATTLLAAAMEGRRAIGAELDPETFAKAVKRLEKGWTVDMFAGAKAPAAEQMALGGTDGE